MCTHEPESPASKPLSPDGVRRALGNRSQQDVLAILELVESLVRARDWQGLTELFSDS